MIIKILNIETKRLKLTEIKEEDTELIVKWRSEPEVYKYFISAHAITVNEHLKWFRNKYLYDMNRFDYIARTKKDNTALGIFGIKKSVIFPGSIEISYILDSLYRGKGYASEAVYGVIEFAKKEWHCGVVIAKIHKDNKASIHFAEKLGFKPFNKEEYFIIYSKELY